MASMTRRLVEAYAADEPSKAEHDKAMACRDADDCVANGIRLFRRIAEVDARTQTVGRGASEQSIEECLVEIDSIYSIWLVASRRWLDGAELLMAEGYDVEGLDEFRATIEEAAILLGNADFEGEILPLDELMSSAKPDNPRPDRYRD